MAWVKLDDDFPGHPKVNGLPTAAKWLYIEGLCYASRYSTDGFVPTAMLSQASSKRAAVDLVEAGLWEPVSSGWAIHDYLDHQRSKAEIDSIRASTRERMKRVRAGNVRQHKQDVREMCATHTREEAETEPETEKAAAELLLRRRAYSALENLVGTLPKPVIDAVNEFLEGRENGPEWVEAAAEEAALGNGRSWKYVKAILDRWERDGFKSERKNDANSNGWSGRIPQDWRKGRGTQSGQPQSGPDRAGWERAKSGR